MASPPIIIRFKGKVENLDDIALSVRVIKKPTMSHIEYPSPRYPNYNLHCSGSVLISLRDSFVRRDTLYLNHPLILNSGINVKEGSVATISMLLGSRDLMLEYNKERIALSKKYYAIPYEEHIHTLSELENQLNLMYCQKARLMAQQAMG